MNRRQFLRAVGVAGTATGLSPLATAANDGRVPGGGPLGGHGDPLPGRGTPGTGSSTSTGTGTTTSTGTPTATPTEAVATPTTGWEPSGRVAVPGATETVLSADGETAFVAVGDGFATVDVSDPAAPTVLTREAPISPPGTDRTLAEAFDVKYDDGELLVAAPAGYHPDSFRGVVRFDVTDPAAPEPVSAYETTFPVHNCFFRDGYAYLTGNDGDRNPLVVVDAAGEPTEVARWSVLDHDDAWASVDSSLRRLHDVWVQNGLAYLAYWDAGTWILDVSDPAAPSYVADVPAQPVEELGDLSGLAAYREALEPPGNVHYVATDPSGSVLAVGKESWNSNAGLNATTPGPDDPGGPSGIDLYDVGEASSPTHLAAIAPPPTADPNVAGVWTTAHNFEVGEQYLYSSWYQGGVKVHDLADPSNPERVRYFRRSSTTSFWTAQLTGPGETVVAASRRDPADPAAPAELFTFPDVPRGSTGPGTEDDVVSTESRSPSSPSSPRSASPAGSPSSPAPASPPQDDSPTGNADSPAGQSDRTTGGHGPGFGPVAALAGLGLGAWRLVRGDDESWSE